jgi:magnesium-protoporphyrin O-methyltransferase
MSLASSYQQRRGQIETYFDRTAVQAWARLTSDAPVSGIRATVRAGRDRMRGTLLSWLPADMTGRRLLDAGCGTGALAVEVVAIDLSPTLVDLARERLPQDLKDRAASGARSGTIDFRSGDMLDAALGSFDHVVGMDSLIHYNRDDVVRVLGALAARTSTSLVFTFAPRTPLLSVMHGVGKLFPRGDRAPMIVPLAEASLRKAVATEPAMDGWACDRTLRVSSGFYISQAMELIRK